ncbi:MAG: phosphotransferase [Candidatus Schekmanbacteria bacterium]|nr:phosphotransferase [Candidatus Schekmanbacteria bacterium]
MGDASTRRYYRLGQTDYPQTLILMQLGDDNHAQGDLFHQQQGLFREIGLPVPQIHHYDEKQGLMFLEDCGDMTLQLMVQKKGLSACLIYYRKAIDWLLKLQEATISAGRHYPAFHWAFDTLKFTEELEFFAVHMLEHMRHSEFAPDERRNLRMEFQKLAAVLAAEPRYLTHRDYHSRNIMIIGDELKILDFQDARLGLCQYDLASLLRDSYVQLPDKMIDELLTYYLNKRGQYKLPPIENDQFQRLFTLTCVQRNLKALGTFAYQAVKRQNDVYLPYIPPTLQYVNLNLRRFPETAGLHKILASYLPELN